MLNEAEFVIAWIGTVKDWVAALGSAVNVLDAAAEWQQLGVAELQDDGWERHLMKR